MKIRTVPAVTLALASSALAQIADAPPVDVNQLLQGLRQFKEQNDTSVKTRRNNAYQQVMAAAATPEKAAAFWAEAVLAVQFAGVDQQTSAVREWKAGEGEGLRSKEGSAAARLHLLWLGLSIQHASGVEMKVLLPSVLDFARQVEADRLMMEKLDEAIDKAKANAGGARRIGNKSGADDVQARTTHNNIMRTSVADSPVARKLQIADLLGGGRRKKADDGEGGSWEFTPGNLNGIYGAIILPEFRATKDPRILEYWDMVLKQEQQGISSDMADYKEHEARNVKQPRILWNRAQDMLLIGLRNRAVSEMFNLIKTYPQHPDVAGWIAKLEGILAPAPDSSTPAPGAVAPPANVPTATILPPGNVPPAR